jgi:choline dehydrogenase-like flavoprotein
MGDPIGNNRYDAIVIGSGMSGGWAAKEFTEKGFKTLVLERGRDVRHIKDYPTTNMMPWEFEHRGEIPESVREANPSVSRCYAFREDAMHFFVKDTDHPYVQERPFDWIRGYQVGGKSIMWARQTQRWSDFDFEGPVTGLPPIGPFAIRILLPGIVTLKNSWEFPATRTACLNCRMGNFCHRWS